MDNHQWRLSQAYTYAFHISIHISITLIPYHLIFLLHVNLFPVTCSMSLAYPLSILFLCSYFYTLHIPILIMFISFHVRILCMYHIHSYLVYFHITYLILSCTFIYILILFIYGTFICFHLILFMYCTFICLLPVSSLFHLSVLRLITFYVLLHISFLILYLYHVFLHVVATRPCYTFRLPLSFLYFLYFTCPYPFHVLYFVLSIYCIHVLFISYTVFLLYFSYDSHILCFSSYIVIYISCH